MAKVILITGATGKQGGAVINALINSPEAEEFTILALTRNTTSPSAEKLSKKSSNIKLIQGDLDDCASVFKNAKDAASEPIWGVFSIQVPMGKGASPEKEEEQGKALIDESIANGVKNFVYTSVDRGGDKSYDNPTPIPHFISKNNVEHHLKEKVTDGEMQYTVLRPTAFFDNFTPDFPGKGFSTCWKITVSDKPLQLIACSDIGYFAAQAFIKPEEYSGKFISLAGDDLKWEDAARIFQEKTGQEMPTTYEFVAKGFMWAVKEFGIMMKWFNDEGYGANIAELKKTHPGLLDFGTWLEKESKFTMK